MLKSRKLTLAIVFLLFLGGAIFAASGKGTGEASTTTPAQVPPITYHLYFEKSPKNKFYFGTAADPTVEFVSSGSGLEFSLPGAAGDGYPSTAEIGIFYHVEQPTKIEVWFNSETAHNEKHRMKTEGPDIQYLSFLVGMGNTLTDAQADLLSVEQANPDFNSALEDPTAVDPVLTVFCQMAAPSEFNRNLRFSENEIGENGQKVFCLKIKSPADYMGGQYKGYIIMDLTTY